MCDVERTSTMTLVPWENRGWMKTQNTSYARHRSSSSEATCSHPPSRVTILTCGTSDAVEPHVAVHCVCSICP